MLLSRRLYYPIDIITFAGREIVKQIQQLLMVFCQNNLYFSRLVRISNKNLKSK